MGTFEIVLTSSLGFGLSAFLIFSGIVLIKTGDLPSVESALSIFFAGFIIPLGIYGCYYSFLPRPQGYKLDLLPIIGGITAILIGAKTLISMFKEIYSTPLDSIDQ